MEGRPGPAAGAAWPCVRPCPQRDERLIMRTVLHSLRTRLRWAFLALLLGAVLGQTALLAHAMEHALDDGGPVCEVCTVSQNTADTAAVPAVARAVRAPDRTPFLATVPPAPGVRAASARDPPFSSLS